jgi:hypothetical protein
MASESTLDLIVSIYTDTHAHIVKAVADLPDDRCAEQFEGCVNHPAWTLSHLCCAENFLLTLLDSQGIQAAEYAHCRPGSLPTSVRGDYRSMPHILADWALIRDAVVSTVHATHATHFSRPSPPQLASFAPTLGRIAVYLLAAHGSYHLGQLMQWRRAAGLVTT